MFEPLKFLMYWTSLFVILGVSDLFCRFYSLFILIANNVDPDYTPRYVASDLGLQCLPMIIGFIGGFPGKNGLREGLRRLRVRNTNMLCQRGS